MNSALHDYSSAIQAVKREFTYGHINGDANQLEMLCVFYNIQAKMPWLSKYNGLRYDDKIDRDIQYAMYAIFLYAKNEKDKKAKKRAENFLLSFQDWFQYDNLKIDMEKEIFQSKYFDTI